jgi:hypothetical protein
MTKLQNNVLGTLLYSAGVMVFGLVIEWYKGHEIGGWTLLIAATFGALLYWAPHWFKMRF